MTCRAAINQTGSFGPYVTQQGRGGTVYLHVSRGQVKEPISRRQIVSLLDELTRILASMEETARNDIVIRGPQNEDNEAWR